MLPSHGWEEGGTLMETRRMAEGIGGDDRTRERRVIAIGKRVRHRWLVEMRLAEPGTVRPSHDRRKSVRAA